jgi:acetyl esterase
MHEDMRVLLKAREETDRRVGPTGDDHVHARTWWKTYARLLAQPRPPGLEVDDRTVRVEEREVPVRVYRGGEACVLYMHGGGFTLGDLDDSDGTAWGLAEGTGAKVVSVDYRRTPEHPYPAAFDDCYGVLSWVAKSGSEPVAVAGDSAGGLLAAALALAARDRGGPAIAAQAMVYPVTAFDESYPSYDEYAEGYGLTRASMARFLRRYLPTDPGTDDPYARPVAAADLSGLPPALVHTAELDPIRDEGRDYASKLALAGTDVVYREARRMIHGFLRARFTGPAVRREFAFLCAFLRGHLDNGR